MPFTFAHPAAAVPLRRWLGRAGVLSALVIGSMAPDLTYFVPFGVDRASTHSLTGVLWFCLPLGVVTYYIFNFLVRPVMYVLLPPTWRDRLTPLLDHASLIPSTDLDSVGFHCRGRAHPFALGCLDP